MPEETKPKEPKQISRLLTYGQAVIPVLVVPASSLENPYVKAAAFFSLCLLAGGIGIMHLLGKKQENIKEISSDNQDVN